MGQMKERYHSGLTRTGRLPKAAKYSRPRFDPTFADVSDRELRQWVIAVRNRTEATESDRELLADLLLELDRRAAARQPDETTR